MSTVLFDIRHHAMSKLLLTATVYSRFAISCPDVGHCRIQQYYSVCCANSPSTVHCCYTYYPDYCVIPSASTTSLSPQPVQITVGFHIGSFLILEFTISSNQVLLLRSPHIQLNIRPVMISLPPSSNLLLF